MNDTTDRRFWEKELYNLLSARLGDCVTGRGLFDVTEYANRMGITPEGLYKYLRADRLTVEGAKKVIAASDGRITEEDMLPFVFR